jgi:hypothetical protein
MSPLLGYVGQDGGRVERARGEEWAPRLWILEPPSFGFGSSSPDVAEQGAPTGGTA